MAHRLATTASESRARSTTTKWPFMFVTDGAGRGTGWVVLHAPIQSPSRLDMYADYRRSGFGFIGMTSFMTFPANPGSTALDYASICQGWAHCFRDPDRFLPRDQPRALLSLSDFTDPARITPHRFVASAAEDERFDFVYVCSDEPWKRRAKNWSLAKRCISRLCGQLELRGLMVGVDPAGIRALPGLTVRPWLPYEHFLRLLAGSRFLFVPNEWDASPRVLAEALCLNVPILVNRALIGGWKYVAAATGRFFDDEHDVTAAADQCLHHAFRARSWYLSQFGPGPAGRKLLSLVSEIDPLFARPGPLGLSYTLNPAGGGRG